MSHETDPVFQSCVTSARECDIQGVKVEKKVSGKEYWVFSASSKQKALTFLRQIPVPRRLLYVIVETAEGNFGKDCEMIFNESDGSQVP